jgi:hypothetical protein
MLRLIGFIVVVLWVLGLIARIGGGFIHILLIAGIIMLIMDFMGSRKSI